MSTDQQDLPKEEAMTALLPQTKADVSDAKTLTAALKRYTDQKPVAVPEKPSKAPKLVPVKQEAKDALKRLSDLLSSTELPSERRALTVTEQQQLLDLGVDSKAVDKAVAAAVAAVKTAIFNHLDVGLDEEGDLPVDPKSGHYLVKGELEVEGTGKKFVRQLAEGEPFVSVEEIKRLRDEGKITRAAYYRITRQPLVPREIDEDGLLDEIKRDPEFMATIGEIVQPGKVTASFWIRDVNED